MRAIVPYTAYKKPNERTLITPSLENLLQKDLISLPTALLKAIQEEFSLDGTAQFFLVRSFTI
jgi:hypothetical protein